MLHPMQYDLTHCHIANMAPKIIIITAVAIEFEVIAMYVSTTVALSEHQVDTIYFTDNYNISCVPKLGKFDIDIR